MKKVIFSIMTILLVAIMVITAGCSGSGFACVGGSGAFYNPNNEYSPEIVKHQPTQTVSVGRASMLPSLRRKK